MYANIRMGLERIVFSDAVPFGARGAALRFWDRPCAKYHEYEQTLWHGEPRIQPVMATDLHVVPSCWEIVG
jgi:hypothetical protein